MRILLPGTVWQGVGEMFTFFRILEDDTIPMERKKTFTTLLTEVYLISDRESLTAVSTLANAKCVDIITFSNPVLSLSARDSV